MAASLDQSLQRFLLDGIRRTGCEIGRGAYATVFEYDHHGVRCVGKEIHPSLCSHAAEVRANSDALRRFHTECEILAELHHPNIVQFLGVHVEPDSTLPVLVMEYLPEGNLSSYLESHGTFPDKTSFGILRDVAFGLCYLHERSTPIIHRDLSANNVLLTSNMSAKISDLGMAKILNISHSKTMSTKAPGTTCYMPPEALTENPSYTRSIDSFSFGVLTLHTLCGEWPFPLDSFLPCPGNTGIFKKATEVERRAKYLEQVGSNHPLYCLIRQCLSCAAADRPQAARILTVVNSAVATLTTISPLTEEESFQKEALQNEVATVGSINDALRAENSMLKKGIAALKSAGDKAKVEIAELASENDALKRETVELQSENDALKLSVKELAWERDALTTAMGESQSEMKKLKNVFQSLEREKESLQKEIESLMMDRRPAMPLPTEKPSQQPSTVYESAESQQTQSTTQVGYHLQCTYTHEHQIICV